MALPIKTDSLENIPENARGFYKEVDGVFRLDADLSGYESAEDVQSLKNALKMEKEKKNSKQGRIDELEQQIADAEAAAAEEAGNFKTLWEQEQEKNRGLSDENKRIKSEREKEKLNAAAAKVAKQMTRDSARQELAIEKALKYAEMDDEGNVVFKQDGEVKTVEDMAGLLAKQYEFLADGSGASGGSAPGSNGDSVPASKKASEMSTKEKNDFIDKHGSAAWQKKVQSEK